MDLIRDVALYVFSTAFLSGMLITAISGSARAVKIYLGILSVLFVLVSIAGFAFSSGWLIFLYTQLIVLVLIVFFVIIAGAAVGGGIHTLVHKPRRDKTLDETELDDYLSVADFSALEGITEERTLSRIKNGFYRGGCNRGNWYVHKSELSTG